MPDMGGLGRLPPSDNLHAIKYPLRAVMPRTVTTAERVLALPYPYRPKYDQGAEGACVGFACSWAMSILNRRFYDAPWLYRWAQRIDEWPGEDYEGTSVRAGMDVLRDVGHRRVIRGRSTPIELEHGIVANRWVSGGTAGVDEIRTAISDGIPVVLGIDWMTNFDTPENSYGREWWIGVGPLGRVRGGHAICCYGASDRRQAVKLVNSWGRSYELVWLPYDTLARLLDGIEWPGEGSVILDRI